MVCVYFHKGMETLGENVSGCLGQETRTKGEGPAGDHCFLAQAQRRLTNRSCSFTARLGGGWGVSHAVWSPQGVKSQGLDRKAEGEASGTPSHWCDVS